MRISRAAQQLEPGECRPGRWLVHLLDGEAHVDEHPVSGFEHLVLEHADVDPPPGAEDVDEGELVAESRHPFHDLTGDPEAHR